MSFTVKLGLAERSRRLSGRFLTGRAGAARLRRTTRFAEELAFLDVPSRVAARLLDLADLLGTPGEGPQIRLNLTQGELASWVAATRESVNKVLLGLRAEGLVEVQGHQITILDRRGLERRVTY